LRILVETASFHPQLKMVNVQTYEDLMFMPYGTWGSRFILTNKFIFAYGCMVAYLLIIKDTVPVVFGFHDSQMSRQSIMVITSLVVILPLSLQRDMASLSSASLLSILADVLLVIFMCMYSPVKESVEEAGGMGGVFQEHAFSSHIFIGLGIISQAMTCHPNAMIINGSLQDKTSANWASVVQSSLTIACTMCLIMGIVGFLGYLDETEVNTQIGTGATSLKRIHTHLLFHFSGRHSE
jgi:solute carrier family 38 (sodium-coupled neutral amino acid transporter), member 11